MPSKLGVLSPFPFRRAEPKLSVGILVIVVPFRSARRVMSKYENCDDQKTSWQGQGYLKLWILLDSRIT